MNSVSRLWLAAAALLTFTAVGQLAADPNIIQAKPAVISIEDLASQIEQLASARYSGSELASIKQQLSELQSHFADHRYFSLKTAERIIALWEPGLRPDGSSGDDSTLESALRTLVWRTYHCLRADLHPLSLEDDKRKAEQVEKLARLLNQLDIEAARRKKLPEAAIDGVRTEALRCIARLKEYTHSPAYPLFYYPLPDDAFEKALTDLRAYIQNRIDALIEDCAREASRRAEVPRSGAGKKAAAALEEQVLGNRGSAMAALTMGNIVRNYAFTKRNLDVTDAEMFPFWKVNSVGVEYKMHEGLRFQLGIDQTAAR